MVSGIGKENEMKKEPANAVLTMDNGVKLPVKEDATAILFDLQRKENWEPFYKLTLTDGNRIWINPHKITTIREVLKGEA